MQHTLKFTISIYPITSRKMEEQCRLRPVGCHVRHLGVKIGSGLNALLKGTASNKSSSALGVVPVTIWSQTDTQIIGHSCCKTL